MSYNNFRSGIHNVWLHLTVESEALFPLFTAVCQVELVHRYDCGQSLFEFFRNEMRDINGFGLLKRRHSVIGHFCINVPHASFRQGGKVMGRATVRCRICHSRIIGE